MGDQPTADRPRPARQAHSLRLRLLLLSAVTITVALAIAGLALTATFERQLERREEQELSVRLLELASGFAIENDQPVLTKRLADPRYDEPLSGAYWQISDASGPVLRSRSLWDETLTRDALPGSEIRAGKTTGPGGAVLTMLERNVKLDVGGTPRVYRLAVAFDRAELTALGDSFREDALLALGAIGAVLVLGAWLQLSLGLAPLRHLQDQLVGIQAGKAARLEGVFPAEIAPLAADLNALIDRQEDSIRRARERAGDLAHGLKTPLTILGSEARRLEEAGDHASAERVREQIRHMRAHVERQLARARSRGSAVAGGHFTDATRTFDRLLRLMRRMPRSDGLEWRNTVPPGVRLRMDPDDFGEVVGNLLDNARLWAHTRVTVSGALAGQAVRIIIDDDGPGIPPEHRALLQNRGETATTSVDGSGLGLAIVTDVLGLYETTLVIEDAPDGGCRVAFDVPGWIEMSRR